jgi:hypothetical protein
VAGFANHGVVADLIILFTQSQNFSFALSRQRLNFVLRQLDRFRQITLELADAFSDAGIAAGELIQMSTKISDVTF